MAMVRLTSAQKYKVQTWVDAWRDVIKNEGWTIPKLTAEIRSKVDFEITESIVANVAKDFGIELTNTRPDVKERIETTKDILIRVDRLERQEAETLSNVLRMQKIVDDANTLIDTVSKDNADLRKENEELRKELSEVRNRMSRLDVEFNDLLKHFGLKRLDSIVGKLVSSIKPV